ncbi:MAG: hypothetical protein JSW28_08835 [Thermoplasmata archaeon]|nr:MAG: hypothetical protein JSW28_08835 [Thermoplasmata archaeon]
MYDESKKLTDLEDSEQGVLDREASIWEVLRKSEEKIRVERKRINEEKAVVERLKEKLFKEKDELNKLKDEVISEKKETIKERDQLSESKDHLAVLRHKATRIIGRLEEQHLNLRDRIEEVNKKIREVEQRTASLLTREKALLKTDEGLKAKGNEYIRWENEIIEKEKEVTNKVKALTARESDLTEREKALNARENAINKSEQERVAKENDLAARYDKLLAREKDLQDEQERLTSMKIAIMEREKRLLAREKILEEGEVYEPIEPLSKDIKAPDLEKVEGELGIAPGAQVSPQLTSDEGMVTASREPVTTGEDTVTPHVTVKDQPEAKEEMEEAIDEERACPRCGTMISKVATTCFACGTDLTSEVKIEEAKASLSEGATTISEDTARESPKESEFLRFEEKEKEEEFKLPSKEELYTLSDDELVRACTILGLDTDGRTKHLRERLLGYMEKMESEEGKKAADQIATMGQKEGDQPTCSECGNAMNYIEQYDRYYCYTCEKYAPKEKT